MDLPRRLLVELEGLNLVSRDLLVFGQEATEPHCEEPGAMAEIMKAFGAGFKPPPKEEVDDSQAKKKGKKKVKKANPKVRCGVIHPPPHFSHSSVSPS